MWMPYYLVRSEAAPAHPERVLSVSKEIKKTVQDFLESIKDLIQTPIILDGSSAESYERERAVKERAMIFFAKNRRTNCKSGLIDDPIDGFLDLDQQYRESLSLSVQHHAAKTIKTSGAGLGGWTLQVVQYAVADATEPMLEVDVSPDAVLNAMQKSQSILEVEKWWDHIANRLSKMNVKLGNGIVNLDGHAETTGDLAVRLWNKCVLEVQKNQNQKEDLMRLFTKILKVEIVFSEYAAKIFEEAGGPTGSKILSDLDFEDLQCVHFALFFLKRSNCTPYLKIGHRGRTVDGEMIEVTKEKTSVLDWVVSLGAFEPTGKNYEEWKQLSGLIADYDNRMEAVKLRGLAMGTQTASTQHSRKAL
jgi:hypothetical protein